MSTWETAAISIFIAVLFLGVFAILFGLPGTVLILVDSLVYAAFTKFEQIGLTVILLLALLAALSEAVDFTLGMTGVVPLKPSSREVGAFFIGGTCGALLLSPFLLGFGFISGTFLGGYLSIVTMQLLEWRHTRPSLRPALGELLSRAAGTCIKGFISLIMVVITLTRVYS